MSATLSRIEIELYALQSGRQHHLDGLIDAVETMHRLSDWIGTHDILDEPDVRRDYEDLVGRLDGSERRLVESRARPLIQQFYEDAQTVHGRELKDLFAACSGLTDEPRAAILQASQRLVNKFIHPCAYGLKRHSGSGVSTTPAQTPHDIAQKQPDIGAGQ